MDGRLRVTLLGGFEARLRSGAVVRLPNRKAQALLAYLGIRPGQGHARDKLAALLWGEKSDDQARGDLRHALVALRRALAGVDPQPLHVQGQTLALYADAVDVDAAIFERLVGEGTMPALEQAAELYRGDLLLGFSLSEPLFEEWLVAERERLREVAVEALTRLLAEQAKTAPTERAIQTAVRLLALDPLQETVHRALMRLYSRQGRRGAALKQYQMCVAALRRELGTEPEKETRALYQELVRGAAAEPRASRSGRIAGPATPDFPEEETPLFGREAELDRLRQMLDAAIRGHGQIATVLGEAGIGKTRLASALAAEAVSHGCRVLIGRSHESDSILPFGPWVDAFRAGELSADEAILDALHPARRAELTRLLPEAGRAGLPPAGDSALPLFESVAAFIESVAGPQPLLLVLEDLHWADEMTLRLLAFVSRRIPGWTALLIVTAREEELADASLARRTIAELSNARSAGSLVLSPLSRRETAQLVRALARVGSEPPAAAQVEARIWAMSEGNPFVAVEAMRALDQPGLSAGMAAFSSPPDLPARVRDLVARRLDRLSARGQQLAAVAAVIGRRFDFALLTAAGGLDEREAAEAVEEMVRRRVLQAVGHHLDFTHDRVREVAYDRLLPPRRRLVHRAVAEALESMGAGPPDRPGEQIEQLAHHAVRGERWEKAVRYLRQAGDKAAARSALPDALAWQEQALAALAALPESRFTLEEAFEIRLAMRPVLTQLNEIQKTLERLREAEALAERLNDDRRRGQVRAFMTNVHALLVELDDAVASGQRALEIAGRLGDLRLRIPTTTYLEVAHYWRGDYAQVVALATDNLATLPADWVHESFGSTAPASVYDRSFLVLALAELGRFAEADEHAAAAIQLAEPTRHGFTISLAYRSACTLHLVKGDWARARSTWRAWISVIQVANVILHRGYSVAVSAWLLAQLGEAAPALDHVREGEQLATLGLAGRAVSMVGWYYRAHGRACLLLGRLDEARRWCDRAVEFSTRQPGFMAYALHLRGDVASHPEHVDVERADACYREALALAEPRGMRPLIAHCHLGLGALARRTGQHGRAAAHLGTAATMYRSMDMQYWVSQVEAELPC
jgi:DNA-binding SARP family transcriptional activator